MSRESQDGPDTSTESDSAAVAPSSFLMVMQSEKVFIARPDGWHEQRLDLSQNLVVAR